VELVHKKKYKHA